MGDLSKMMDFEQAISYADDMVKMLKDKKDINNLTHCLESSKTLRSSCDADFDQVQKSIREYEEKIDECEHKTETARFEAVSDEDLEQLQIEFHEELVKEKLLMEELRVTNNEINDLEHKRVSVQEQKQTQMKLEKDKLKAQRKLAMYASVTSIIPDLDDQSIISGHIVDRDTKLVKKFEFDPIKINAIDTCDSIWKMIDSW